MAVKWTKKGLIFSPGMVKSDFIKSHAQIPTVLNMGKKLRIYFATRPEPGVSLTTFIDVCAQNPSQILYVHDAPILSIGRPGEFDSHGIMPQYVMEASNEVRLYYGGWSRRQDIPYSNWTGLARSIDSGFAFEKMFRAPVIDRNFNEIYSATGLFIFQKEIFYAFYASGVDWINVDQRLEELYTIKSATSFDGVNWKRDGKPLFTANPEKLEAIHRPSVIQHDKIFHMWFCFRGLKDFRDGYDAYRIGYAYSIDLLSWVRDDSRAGISISENSWDSRMIAYPYVINTDYGTYMFYNGNGFGRTGFGYAVLEEG
jgi:hypothetical protein